jgi:hypothetical protein
MQTMAVEIQDNYVTNFMSYVNNHSENISILRDSNLELDPYFYERQKKLQQIRSDVKNGNMRLLSQEESDNEIELFFKELEK